MAIDYSVLFEPLEIGPLPVKNRIVCPPMVTMRNIVGEDGIAWYERMAQGGAGTVIVEATSVRRFGTELTVESLRRLAEAIHWHGAAAAIQLFPVGFGQKVAPADLSPAEIDLMIEQYRRAAKLCRDAEFDAVEPHGAHGYVLNQFFSPRQNKRTDEYGGGEPNRMRLALEIVRAIREAVGSDLRIFYRHTPRGAGYQPEDSIPFAQALVKAGVDVLDLSPSSDKQPGDIAGLFKPHVSVPIITVGDMACDGRGVEALRKGRADLIAIGRQLIADPHWPNKVRQGRFDEIIHCAKCNELCFGNLPKGEPIACAQWDEGGARA
jgi:2,4-dienoyl-CoA reductase-like NADH-dependent reductase (Old Yellow Enzyme family)